MTALADISLTGLIRLEPGQESIVINVEARALKLEDCGSKRSLRNLRKCNESRFKRSEQATQS
ncbi:hypothetical protein N7466_010179 [Penicillium verhagenii]|uniref:uncharacterized protein n=1 Tax=Penicillium verhagenii TaxID=1562060 RepID=UPI002544F33A|nr:uncharacterized protein N7466_010179 [Penicillium verhagenii]KAJ5919236.1 hypothetical protein N7466_010179 [Penicillium verhagenii]